jgi:2-oxo-4-hydroxy-4-carboxy-5-ureidoimidazoline decarboxylase
VNCRRINAWTEAEARAAFLGCCGSPRWADEMAARRPFAGPDDLFAAAEQVWQALPREEWLRAFAAHPRIGDLQALRAKFAGAADPAREQAGVAGAAGDVLRDLAEGNARYEAKFGHLFIVCATGKTAPEMLALLRQRLDNGPGHELLCAAGEQARITRLRLEKLCQ